jgi:hypothetical protein
VEGRWRRREGHREVDGETEASGGKDVARARKWRRDRGGGRDAARARKWTAR